MLTELQLSSSSVVDQLIPALITCFGVILLGYLAGHFQLLTTAQASGLNYYVTKFALPAVFFKVMATIDFSGVSWLLVVAVSISKAIVFFTAFVVTLLISRHFSLGMAAVLAMFVSQSNDVALGYPVLKALFPDLSSYIYLFAPAQLVILNPVAYFALEWFSAEEQTTSSAASYTSVARRRFMRVLHVLGRVFLNPIFFMTVIGVIFNFILKHKIPIFLEGLFGIVADSFAAAALFSLGFGMVGITSGISKHEVYVLVAILTCKLVVLPFVNRELVAQFLPLGGMETNTTVRYSTFAFLYGAIPTAPPVYLFAAHYRVLSSVVGAGLVGGTFLCAPMIFLLAHMITLYLADSSEYGELLDSTVRDICWTSIFCSIWTLIVLFISRKAFHIPHRFTVCYLFCVILTCSGVVAASFLNKVDVPVNIMGELVSAEQLMAYSPATWMHYLQFTVFFIGCTGARCWTTLLVVCLLLERARGLCFLLRHQMWIYVVGFASPVLVTSLLLLTSERQTVKDIHPIFQYGHNQLIVSLVVLVINISVTLFSLIYYIRLGSGCTVRYDVLPSAESFRTSPTHVDPGDKESNSFGESEVTAAISNEVHRRLSLQIDNAVTRHVAPRCRCQDIVQRDECLRRLSSYDRQCTSILAGHYHPDSSTSTSNSGRNPDEQVNLANSVCLGEYQHHYHLTLLLIVIITMFFGICLCTWRLVREAHSGVYVVLEFSDGAFNFGQGLVLFVIFGLDVDLIILPIKRIVTHHVRRLFVSCFDGSSCESTLLVSEEVQHGTEKICRQFSEFHLESCKRQIAQPMVVNCTRHENVTTEEALVQWLCDSGLVRSADEANTYLEVLERCQLVRELRPRESAADPDVLRHRGTTIASSNRLLSLYE